MRATSAGRKAGGGAAAAGKAPAAAGYEYSRIQGLRLEAREKLAAVRPLDLGQASRISGVSPADIAALMIWLHTRTERGDAT